MTISSRPTRPSTRAIPADPLFNLAGDVVGVNTAIYSPSGGSVGIGFSVPAATVKGIVDQLVKYGETRRGWLGVRIQSLTDDLAEGLDLGARRRALSSPK